MSDCDCHPGTEENGWHETRSEHCRTAELAEWERTMEIAQDIASRINPRSLHNHLIYVEGCYRCELSRQDGQDTVRDRRQAVLTELRKLADGTHPVTLLTGIENLDELGGTDG